MTYVEDAVEGLRVQNILRKLVGGCVDLQTSIVSTDLLISLIVESNFSFECTHHRRYHRKIYRQGKVKKSRKNNSVSYLQ